MTNISAKWSWRCFFGIHQWTNWSDAFEGTLTGLLTGNKHLGVDFQERSCTSCNKIERRLA